MVLIGINKVEKFVPTKKLSLTIILKLQLQIKRFKIIQGYTSK